MQPNLAERLLNGSGVKAPPPKPTGSVMWIPKVEDLRAQKAGEASGVELAKKQEMVKEFFSNPPPKPAPVSEVAIATAPKPRGRRPADPNAVKVIASWVFSTVESWATQAGELTKLVTDLYGKRSYDGSAAMASRIANAQHRLSIARDIGRQAEKDHSLSYCGDDAGKEALWEAMSAINAGMIQQADFRGGVILTLLAKEAGSNRLIAVKRKFYYHESAATNAGLDALDKGVTRPAIESEGIIRRPRLDVYRISPEQKPLSRRERARLKAANLPIPEENNKLRIVATGRNEEELERFAKLGEVSVGDLHTQNIPIVDFRVSPVLTAQEVKMYAPSLAAEPYLTPHQRAAKRPETRFVSYNRSPKHWGKAVQTRNTPCSRAHSRLGTNWPSR